jgi:hypothetical protein
VDVDVTVDVSSLRDDDQWAMLWFRLMCAVPASEPADAALVIQPVECGVLIVNHDKPSPYRGAK